MGRAKVAMERITDHKKRNITFRNRKEGLFKKTRELATLCDVNVSMIICTDDHQEPEIFPPDVNKLNKLINRYKRNRITDPSSIRYYGLLDFFKDRKIKIEEELAKAKKKNLEAKYPTWFDFLNTYSEGQLRDFASKLEGKIAEVKTRIQTLKKTPKIQNLDCHPIYPNNPVLDVDHQNGFITPSLNPNPMISCDPNNFIVKSSNPEMSAYMDSFLEWLMNDDIDNNCYDCENFNLQSQSSFPVPPPMIERMAMTPFMNANPLSMAGCSSQVMESNNEASGSGTNLHYYPNY